MNTCFPSYSCDVFGIILCFDVPSQPVGDTMQQRFFVSNHHGNTKSLVHVSRRLDHGEYNREKQLILHILNGSKCCYMSYQVMLISLKACGKWLIMSFFHYTFLLPIKLCLGRYCTDQIPRLHIIIEPNVEVNFPSLCRICEQAFNLIGRRFLFNLMRQSWIPQMLFNFRKLSCVSSSGSIS